MQGISGLVGCCVCNWRAAIYALGHTGGLSRGLFALLSCPFACNTLPLGSNISILLEDAGINVSSVRVQ